jgi:MFS family permease
LKPGANYGWMVFGAGFLTVVSTYALRNVFSVFYPAIVDEAGWERGATAVMFSLNVLVYGLFSPFAGRVVDRAGARLILPLGAVLAGLSIGLCALAHEPWQFYLGYGVACAAGMGLMGWTPVAALIIGWFRQRRGLIFGMLLSGFGLSLILSSSIQPLITGLGWRGALAVVGGLVALVIAPVCAVMVRNPPVPDRAVSTEAGPPDTGWTVGRALRDRRFWGLFLASFFLTGFAEQTAIAHQVFIFRGAGFTPETAALFFALFGGGFVAGNFLGFLSDRWGRARLFVCACLMAALASGLLLAGGGVIPVWLALFFVLGSGLGFGVAVPLLPAATADTFQGRNYGTIQGFINLGFALGGAVSPWLAGYLYDISGSYQAPEALMVVSLLAAAGMFLMRRPRKTARS